MKTCTFFVAQISIVNRTFPSLSSLCTHARQHELAVGGCCSAFNLRFGLKFDRPRFKELTKQEWSMFEFELHDGEFEFCRALKFVESSKIIYIPKIQPLLGILRMYEF